MDMRETNPELLVEHHHQVQNMYRELNKRQVQNMIRELREETRENIEAVEEQREKAIQALPWWRFGFLPTG